MKLEPKPALKATLCLVLLVGLFIVMINLPKWAVAATLLPLSLGALWWLLYVAFRDLESLHAKTIEAREAAQKAALEAQREADQLKQEKK